MQWDGQSSFLDSRFQGIVTPSGEGSFFFFWDSYSLCQRLAHLPNRGKSSTSPASGGPHSQPASAASASSGASSLPDAQSVSSGPPVQATAPASKQQPKRILGVMPNYRAVSAGAIPPPPTPKQAFKIATQNSFDYSSFVRILITPDYHGHNTINARDLRPCPGPRHLDDLLPQPRPHSGGNLGRVPMGHGRRRAHQYISRVLAGYRHGCSASANPKGHTD